VGIRAVSRAAVFLDRDGVLVEEVFYSPEWEAPLRPEDVRLIPGAAAAARRLAEAGYALVLISKRVTPRAKLTFAHCGLHMNGLSNYWPAKA